MSSRWSGHDTDAERLPEGMKRIGYDADSQKYTFRDADGSIWESASGNRYGQLRRVTTSASTTSTATARTSSSSSSSYSKDYDYGSDDGIKRARPLTNFDQLEYGEFGQLWHDEPDHETSWRQELKPLLTRFLSVTLDDLLKKNGGLDRDKLSIGETIRVPAA